MTGPADAAKTIRPLSQSRKNPFAKKTTAAAADDSSQGGGATPSPRGLAIFDQPANKATPNNKTGPSKENLKTANRPVTKQPTLFGMKKTAAKEATSAPVAVETQSTHPVDQSPAAPPKSGFMLWLEQNKPQLQADHPDANDAELVRLAAQKFKTLPEDERQVFLNSKFICI